MINGARVLGLIPARSGSKRLPGKNIRVCAGKPMIAWTIEAALAARTIDRIVVSTDDDEIAETVSRLGAEVPFRRPDELANDTATSVDMTLHALDFLDEQFDYLVLLQPTSPLRLAEDVDGIIQYCEGADAQSCVAVSEAEVPLRLHYTIDADGHLAPMFTSENGELEKTYVPNGAAYVVDIPWFRQHKTFYHVTTVAFIMPESRAVDVDTEQDFLLAEMRMLQRNE